MTWKVLKNKFPGSNWRVILIRIKQSEVFDKVSVTEICVFLTRPGTVTDFWFFWRVKKNISRKKSHHVSRLSLGYLWEEYEKFWFFIMCQIFTIWLGFNGHSLLRQNMTTLKPVYKRRIKFNSQWLLHSWVARDFIIFLKSKTKKPPNLLSSSGMRGSKFISMNNFSTQEHASS